MLTGFPDAATCPTMPEPEKKISENKNLYTKYTRTFFYMKKEINLFFTPRNANFSLLIHFFNSRTHIHIEKIRY